MDLGETIIFQSSYGDLPISKRFSETSSCVELNLSTSIKVDCPVRILHGVQDDSVPFENSIQIMKLLKSQDVDITFRKAGDHRLSEKKDLDILSDTVDSVVNMLENCRQTDDEHNDYEQADGHVDDYDQRVCVRWPSGNAQGSSHLPFMLVGIYLHTCI